MNAVLRPTGWSPTDGADARSADRWGASWTLCWATAALAGLALPFHGSELEWGPPVRQPWFWQGNGTWDVLCNLSPGAIAVGSLLALAGTRGRRRGVAVLSIATVGLLAGYVLANLVPWDVAPDPEGGPAGAGGPAEPGLYGRLLVANARLLLALALPAAVLAAGNHLRKRAPESRLPRVLLGLGALALIAGFLIPEDGDRLFIDELLRHFRDQPFWLPLPWLALLCYAGVGVGAALDRSAAPLLASAWVRGLILLCVLVELLLWLAPGSPNTAPGWRTFLDGVKGLLLFGGQFGLVATGLAIALRPGPDRASA